MLVLCSGCSSLIPGVNIYSGSDGSHQYSPVKTDENGDPVTETDSKLTYRVVPINPRVLMGLAGRDADTPGSPLPAILPSDIPPEYRLGPGDVFFVVVWDHPELTTPYAGLTNDLANQGRLVASDGTAYFPYVGTFKAAGMTMPQLRNYLADRLVPFIKSPQVDVRVVAYRANRVEVTGAVLRPSTIALDDTPKGVMEAIDLCGGLGPIASQRRAVLVRHNVSYNIDLAGLLSGSRSAPNIALQPGDVLHVPDQSGDQVFVLGAVDKAAPVVLMQSSSTLIQALTVSGGVDKLAGKGSGILVFRQQNSANGETSAVVYTLDLSEPEGMLLASQFQLQPRDVVYVQATEFSQYNSIINQLLPTVSTIFELRQLTK
jgi:polysaccharide export outer membrane protein